MKKIYLLAIALLLISGCSLKHIPIHKQNHKKYHKVVQKSAWIRTALYNEYKQWEKTPFSYGGESSQGIDCSAFVQKIYKNAFNINLPRTTKEQLSYGYKVAKNSMREGDLIFFKTGYNSRHVGIIIQKDKFMHASTKHGVTISSIYNPYWRNKYIQSRRILH